MNATRNIQPPNVHIEVQNFGPIEQAEIDLRPLTVFVGESNTGKTYFAELIYALYNSFGGFARFPWSHHAVLDLGLMMHDLRTPKDPEIIKALKKLNTNGLPLKFSDLPLGTREGLQSNLKDSKVFSEQLKRCFGLESVSGLIRFTGDSCNAMKILMKVSEENQSLWSVNMQVSESDITIDGCIDGGMVICPEDVGKDEGTLGVGYLETRLRQGSQEATKIYYLPATRRSIMQNYAGVGESFIELSSSDVDVLSLSAMETDFLRQIISYKEHNGYTDEMIHISKILAEEMIRGELEIKRAESGRPLEFLYRPHQEQKVLRLSQSSSSEI